MCASSVIYEYGMTTWPLTNNPLYNPKTTPLVPNVTTEAERQALEAFRKLVKQAEEFDKQANQPNCEDPQKAQILERILQRLEVIEDRLQIK